MNRYRFPFGFNRLSQGGMNIAIVQGGNNNTERHKAEHVNFPLNNPIPGVAIIGVADEEFQICFKPDFTDRYAIAAYVDGVNVNQKNGIVNLAQIQESLRELYSSHQLFIGNGIGYLDRFNQSSGQNRVFTFTLDESKGVNYNTIRDYSQMSRIEVYIWKERPRPAYRQDDFALESTRGMSKGVTRGGGGTRSAVGAGAASNQAYGSTSGLNDPIFIGKFVFIHVPFTAVAHLGDRLVYEHQFQQSFQPPVNAPFDPLNLVPRS